MDIARKTRRKAISPVLATVILIAITLIAAIALAGFVFGLFGTFTSSSNLQVSSVNCSAGAGTCTLSVTNTGGSSGSITGCSIYGATDPNFATENTATPVVVPAGTTSATAIPVVCGGAMTAGAIVSGQLVVASGSPLAFSAIAGT